jgi:hypothetical protein
MAENGTLSCSGTAHDENRKSGIKLPRLFHPTKINKCVIHPTVFHTIAISYIVRRNTVCS